MNFLRAVYQSQQWGQAQVDLFNRVRAAMIAQAPVLFPKYGLTDPMGIANAMGEWTEECGGGREVEENLNYRASALHSQWPLFFTMKAARIGPSQLVQAIFRLG